MNSPTVADCGFVEGNRAILNDQVGRAECRNACAGAAERNHIARQCTVDNGGVGVEKVNATAAGPNGAQFFVDGFSGGQLPPKSSIREIRINSNPFSSEFDRPGFGRIDQLDDGKSGGVPLSSIPARYRSAVRDFNRKIADEAK